MRKEVITMLAKYIESHEEKMEDTLFRHPILGMMAGMFIVSAGILLAVSGIACLGALPIYFFTAMI